MLVTPAAPQPALRQFIHQNVRGSRNHVADFAAFERWIAVMEVQLLGRQIVTPAQFTPAQKFLRADQFPVNGPEALQAPPIRIMTLVGQFVVDFHKRFKFVSVF
jgi:hypothetical protein